MNEGDEVRFNETMTRSGPGLQSRADESESSGFGPGLLWSRHEKSSEIAIFNIYFKRFHTSKNVF